MVLLRAAGAKQVLSVKLLQRHLIRHSRGLADRVLECVEFLDTVKRS
jgi:hypothetical protein